jgi:hypothetical protein
MQSFDVLSTSDFFWLGLWKDLLSELGRPSRAASAC